MKPIHQRYTLILVTDELSPVRRMQVSRSGLRRVAGAAIAAGLVIAVGLVDYVRLRIGAVDVAALRAETARQQGELVALGGEVGGLASELERLRELERKVRVIANLPGAMREARVPEPAGQGGGEELPAAADADEGPEAAPPPVGADQAGDDLGARPDGSLDPAALARIQARARQLASLVPARKLSLLDLLEGLEGKSQRLAATPSIWPTSGYVTSGYGNRTSPFTGREQFHAGLDIAADFGTPVIAPARGRVVFSGMNGPFGRMIEIDHGYGLRSHFAHLAGSNVKQGQTVERGTPIGQVGSTGRSTGPHLHYGVEVNGRTVDPTDYIFE
jgi:murein DD-endopeptidase MepM/ murein hydrolase activator NlpD